MIAKNLSIDESTVRRVLHIFTTTGDVSKKRYPAERAFRIITEPVKLLIIHLILQKPGIFLREITSELKSILVIDVSESAVCENKWIYTTKASYIIIMHYREMVYFEINFQQMFHCMNLPLWCFLMKQALTQGMLYVDTATASEENHCKHKNYLLEENMFLP